MKRTYQPKKLQRQKEHGFRKRMSTRNGRKVRKKTCKGQKALKLLILSMNEYAKKYVCIKKDKEFRFLFKKGDSIVTDAFVCYARESKRRVNRIGIVTGKKVGNAVKRSRARRVIKRSVPPY